MNLEDNVKKYYCFHTAQKRKTNGHRWSEKHSPMIFSFIKNLEEVYGKNIDFSDDFLDRYFSFAYSSYYKNFSRVFPNMIFSKKVLIAFKQKKYFALQKSVKEKVKIWEGKYEKVIESDIMPNEEKWKGLSHNTEEGYLLCDIYTTLFNEKSKFCKTCVFKDLCKGRLKTKYKKLFENRGVC